MKLKAFLNFNQRVKSREEINDYHEKRTWSKYTLGSIYELTFFASHSVCTTIAEVTFRWVEFVDEVGYTIFNENCECIFATAITITKADRPGNFIISLSRMSTIQPAWPVCTTVVCFHTHCWHSCSCSSHKTIPSLRKSTVTQLFTDWRFVT